MKVNENIRYYLRQSAYGLVSVSAAFLIGSATISADEVGSVAVGNTQSYAGIPEGVDDRSEVSAAESQRDKLWQKLAYADLRDHIDRKVVEELKDQLKKVELDVSKISALEKAFEAAKLSYFKENKDFTTKAIESAEELTEQQKKSLLEKLSVINSFSELAAIVENAKAFEIANETLVESEHEEVAPQVDKHLEEGKPMAPEVEVPAKPEREEVVPQVDKHLEEGKPMAQRLRYL
ncbi:hypothetical protein NC01_06650 [Streptococcus uberis]|nr:hypothetical protein NC01_06650 [Streptococcus uberis]